MLPQARRRGGAGLPVEGDAEADGPLDDGEPAEPRPGEWAERQARKNAAWRNNLPGLQSSYVQNFPLAIRLKQESQRIIHELLQAEVYGFWKLHTCCLVEGEFDETPLRTLPEEREIIYISLTGCSTIKLPSCHCDRCNVQISPDPLAYGCFPSSPTAPVYWYDLQVYQMYKGAAASGLSATGIQQHDLGNPYTACSDDAMHALMMPCMPFLGFLASLRKAHQPWDQTDRNYPSTNSFEDSFCTFLATTSLTTSLGKAGLCVPGMDEGPFHNCGICCPLPPGTLSRHLL